MVRQRAVRLSWVHVSHRIVPPEWLEVNVMTAMQQIIARASNRVFVGLPVCACVPTNVIRNLADL